MRVFYYLCHLITTLQFMNRQPKLMNFPQMRKIFEPHLEQIHQHIYFSQELGVIRGSSELFRLVMQQKPPFCIDDHRLGIVIQGEATINFNLQDCHLSAGTLVYLGPGTIITPVSISDDLKILGIALFDKFPMPFAPEQLPAAFNGQMRDFQLQADKPAFEAACSIIETLWQVVRQHDYNRQTASSLVAALMHHYDGLYHRLAEQQQAKRSREQTIFDRFLYLVNRHATHQRQIDFYASQMCLTGRYLGTVVSQASNVTAKEWIDRALILRIKVELKHTDKTIAQIADDMHFPNPSFFCKYFRRLTGTTPTEYRKA